MGGGEAALKSRILEFQEVPKIFFAIGDVA